MFSLIDQQSASNTVKELLDATQRQLGRVPNLYRAMANSPTALGGYLAFRGALQQGQLDTAMRERIALLTAQLNNCDYCIAAHTFRMQKLNLPADDIAGTRAGKSELPKIQAALKFVAELLERGGMTRLETRNALLDTGWSPGEIGEMVAHVALNVYSNYFKQVAEPALDFPPAAPVANKVSYSIDTEAVPGSWVQPSAFDFETTVQMLKEAIAGRELWLIHEIDPRMLLAREGLNIQPARQLLFFHPRYMRRLLEADARAVQEAPLKIVVMADESGAVVLRGPDLRAAFHRYPGMQTLAEELATLCADIVATVSDRP